MTADTESNRVLPNFLIVGAAKSGTTSLFHYLGQHPDVYTCPCKEPCFFSEGKPVIAHSEEEYTKLFSGSRQQSAIGEASTSYLYDPGAAGRIKELLGMPRIIILLRNPATRAYSAWGHNRFQTGCEQLSFEDALAAETDRIASHQFKKNCTSFFGDFHYFHQGLYSESVNRYLDLFGDDRVKVLIFEEFINDALSVCQDVFAFLGVSPEFRPELTKKNVSPAIRFRSIHRFLVSPPVFLNSLYNRLPIKMRLAIYRAAKKAYWLNQQQHDRPPLAQETLSMLTEKYRPDIEKLEDVLNRDLSLWYTEPEEAGA